jgi:hypothetical protein
MVLTLNNMKNIKYNSLPIPNLEIQNAQFGKARPVKMI